jgi:hypothetical protein
MSNAIHATARLSPLAAAFGLAVALIVLFVICAIVQALAPGLQATHAWIGLSRLPSPDRFAPGSRA